MKKLYLSFVLVLVTTAVMAQNKKLKIVFDVTSSDTKVHESAVRHVKGMAKAYPGSEFEMVVYSGALPMMLKGQSTLKPEIEKLAKVSNVSLKVCEMALEKSGFTSQDLIDEVGTVPNGIIEIIEKQNEGWGYIKEAN